MSVVSTRRLLAFRLLKRSSMERRNALHKRLLAIRKPFTTAGINT